MAWQAISDSELFRNKIKNSLRKETCNYLTFWVWIHEPFRFEFHPQVECAIDATREAAESDQSDDDLDGDSDHEAGEARE